MEKYLENVLHVTPLIHPYTETGKFPLELQVLYEYYEADLFDQRFLIAKQNDEWTLTELRKHQKALERYTGMYTAMYLQKMNYYAKDKLIEEGIPFVWEDHQIYLPFLGILLNSKDERMLRPCDKLSFLTQKLLLTALYENWQKVTVTQASEILGVTKMSCSRCFDEIQILGLPFLSVKNRARTFSAEADKKKMWDNIKPFLRNPVIAEFRLEECPNKELIFSGDSALSAYTLLDTPSYPTYAVTKKEKSSLNIYKRKLLPKNETPACVIQEIGYYIPLEKSNMVDPLSLALIMFDEAAKDPRVEIALEEMMEEHVWSKASQSFKSISKSSQINMF